ncbi:MAG: restriction endonuclease [Myxococcales bacterium]|nr:restriction endonuclease [Myxococcales bacterium]
MTTTTAGLREVARRVLRDAGRPLNLRRILRAAADGDLLSDPSTDVDALRAALLDAPDVREVRRGIFGLGEPAGDEEEGDGDGDGEERDGGRGGRRRRRRPRAIDMAGDAPAAPTSVEDAAELLDSVDRAALRRRLWDKVKATAEAVVGQQSADDDDDGEDAFAEGASDEADEAPRRRGRRRRRGARRSARRGRAGRRGRLGRRGGRRAGGGRRGPGRGPGRGAGREGAHRGSAAAPAAQRAPRRGRGGRRRAPAELPSSAPAPAAVVEDDPKAALRRRLAARRSDGGEPAPYAERRADAEPRPAGEERRAPVLPVVRATEALVRAAHDALEAQGAPLHIDALTEAVAEAEDQPPTGLRAALLAENARRRAAGLRPPFVVQYAGEVALTRWGLSDRYLALEQSIEGALAELRELVQRDVLARIAELSDVAFEQVIVMLLEQLGHRDVEVVHRQSGGTVALTVTEPAGGRLAVVARQAWSNIGPDTVRRLRASLAQFGADAGLVMTLGDFTDEAHDAAGGGDQAAVRLVDGARLASLLYDHEVGLRGHAPRIRFVDVPFFESLG